MLPSERRHVLDEMLLGGKGRQRALQILGVPQDDGRYQQVEAGCAEELVLEGAVAQFAETVKEDGTGKGIASLALIEAGMARRRRSGLFSPSIVNSERSIRPISRSATARLWRPYRSRACR